MLKALLIDIVPPHLPHEECVHRMVEAENLVQTYGGIVLLKTVQKRMTPHYRTYIGPGKAEELRQDAKIHDANIVIVNNELKPGQVWNLKEMYQKDQIQVWDRVDLILKIFQKHASTKEAKLEIELASIRHMGPRIFGMGMELSRQGGGIGTRGLGETNTEIMRRHLKEQERKVKKDLDKCMKERKLQRDSRKRRNFPTISIIGYTNAGKSTLLNALTNKGAYAADELFATLDTRIGKVWLPTLEREVLLTDTIGFIQDLPHMLINSFRATLDETIHADLLLHVMDAGDERIEKKMEVVEEVLEELEAYDKPTIFVFNKIDTVDANHLAMLKEEFAVFDPVFVSARKGEGMDALKNAIAAHLAQDYS